MKTNCHTSSRLRSGTASSYSGRRGTTMLELVVGTVLIGVFVTSAVPIIRWTHVSSRLNEQYRVATQELANQMEHLAAVPTSDLETLQLSDAAQATLPDSALTAVADPSTDGLQKVTLKLTWAGGPSSEAYNVRLTAWLPGGHQ